jgi:thiol-disulfide isomerase/thioredoxin
MLIRYSWARRRNRNAYFRIKVSCVMKNILFLLCTILLFNFDKPRDPKLLQHGNMEIVAGYQQLDSFEQIKHIFKGKAVFIDLWATWCEPCIDEFKYSNNVFLYTKRTGINLLYIAFDDDDAKWQAYINKYSLSGSHIRANTELRESIEKMIWGAKDVYSLPHYLFMDTHGALIAKALPQPSEQDLLYKALDSARQH